MNNIKIALVEIEIEIEIEINVDLIPELIIDKMIYFHCSVYGKYIH
ncbi:hypothetical protein NF212_06920 [Parasalinivibrio latis]